MIHEYGHKPQIEARFRTRKGRSFTVREMTAYQSSRTMDDPAATATLSFQGLTPEHASEPSIRDREWKDILGLYDQCQVRMLDYNGTQWVDINGLVSDIAPVRFESNGDPRNSTTISLIGIGQQLKNTSLFFHPHIAGRSNIGGIGWLNRADGKPPSGRPDQVLRQIYEVFINENYNFKMPDGRKLYEAITLSFQEIRDGLVLLALNALGQEENLWNVMKRFADQPFNSMWVDVPQKLVRDIEQRYRGQVSTFQETVYLEPTPFDFSRWDRIATRGSDRYFEVLDEERMGPEQVKLSSEGISTMFWCSGKGVLSGFDQLSMAYENSGGLVPIYFEKGIEALGIRRLEQGTEYVQFFKDDHEQKGVITPEERLQMRTNFPDRASLLTKRTMQLAQWYGWEEGLWKGPITTRGRIGWDPDHGARIGSVMKHKRDKMEYFVTGIMQNWQMHGPWTTTWQLDRGAKQADYRKWWMERLQEVAKGKATAIQIAKELLGDYGLSLDGLL